MGELLDKHRDLYMKEMNDGVGGHQLKIDQLHGSLRDSDLSREAANSELHDRLDELQRRSQAQGELYDKALQDHVEKLRESNREMLEQQRREQQGQHGGVIDRLHELSET